jgi:hypothetical protein
MSAVGPASVCKDEQNVGAGGSGWQASRLIGLPHEPAADADRGLDTMSSYAEKAA